MNVFIVGFPLAIGIGFALMAASLPVSNSHRKSFSPYSADIFELLRIAGS